MRKLSIREFFRSAPARGWKRGRTGKLGAWKMMCGVLLLCAATTVAAPAQTLTTLVNCDATNCTNPSAPLVQATDGNFYGPTYYGGANGYGTVFKITPAGTLTTLYNFGALTECPDGSTPPTGLVLATDGNFYGITCRGGASSNCFLGCGTIFEITPGGTLTTLYNFCAQAGCPDGAFPSRLIQASDGNLYGTTYGGGATGNGTVFKMTPEGTLTTLYGSFCPLGGYPCRGDGAGPYGLVEATNGLLYGQTSATVFRISPEGTLTEIFHMPKGEYPWFGPSTGLVQATDGNLYGVTSFDGAYGGGTIFKITPSGTSTTLYNFCAQPNCADGFSPLGLVQASDGSFYGTTEYGGAGCSSYYSGCGTIFEITPTGELTTLYIFCSQANCTDGAGPGGLVKATSGKIYGTTSGGGAYGYGTVFTLSMGLGPFVKTLPSSGTVGRAVVILGNNLTGSTSVTFNGTPATFTVIPAGAAIETTVPSGATTGPVQVVTPSGALTSNVNFLVMP